MDEVTSQLVTVKSFHILAWYIGCLALIARMVAGRIFPCIHNLLRFVLFRLDLAMNLSAFGERYRTSRAIFLTFFIRTREQKAPRAAAQPQPKKESSREASAGSRSVWVRFSRFLLEPSWESVGGLGRALRSATLPSISTPRDCRGQAQTDKGTECLASQPLVNEKLRHSSPKAFVNRVLPFLEMHGWPLLWTGTCQFTNYLKIGRYPIGGPISWIYKNRSVTRRGPFHSRGAETRERISALVLGDHSRYPDLARSRSRMYASYV